MSAALEASSFESGDTSVQVGMGYVAAGSPEFRMRRDDETIDAQ
jgi:hypothetical protein